MYKVFIGAQYNLSMYMGNNEPCKSRLHHEGILLKMKACKNFHHPFSLANFDSSIYLFHLYTTLFLIHHLLQLPSSSKIEASFLDCRNSPALLNLQY